MPWIGWKVLSKHGICYDQIYIAKKKNKKKVYNAPDDSKWPNFIPDRWRSRLIPLSSGHVNSPSQNGHVRRIARKFFVNAVFVLIGIPVYIYIYINHSLNPFLLHWGSHCFTLKFSLFFLIHPSMTNKGDQRKKHLMDTFGWFPLIPFVSFCCYVF